jgi:hypothetical protein
VLVSHFLNCPAFASEAVISKREKNILFSDILPGVYPSLYAPCAYPPTDAIIFITSCN